MNKSQHDAEHLSIRNMKNVQYPICHSLKEACERMTCLSVEQDRRSIALDQINHALDHCLKEPNNRW